MLGDSQCQRQRTFGSTTSRDFWSCLTPIFLFSLTREERSLQIDLAGDSKGQARGFEGTRWPFNSKCGCTKVWLLKAFSETTCNAANQFGNAMDSQLRAQKDAFRIRSLPQNFQDPLRSTELKNRTILNKLFPPKILANYGWPSATVSFAGTSSFALMTLGLPSHCCCCWQTPAQDLGCPTEPQKKTEPKLPSKQI